MSELATFQKYSVKHGLPFDRLEILLAQICMRMDAYWGGKKNAKLNDYIIRHKLEIEDDISDNLEDLKNYFGFNPINVKD